jgi:hypothetical protein
MKLVPVSCAFLLAARVGLADTLLTNSQPVVFTNTLTPSTAVPYPSTIVVSGLDNHVITKVTVTLHGLSHTYPDDLAGRTAWPAGHAYVGRFRRL